MKHPPPSGTVRLALFYGALVAQRLESPTQPGVRWYVRAEPVRGQQMVFGWATKGGGK